MTKLKWDDPRATHLAGKRCLWQDLDGLHVADAPIDAPYTSIPWAWPGGGGATSDTTVVRMPISRNVHGDDLVFVATQASGTGAALAPYAPNDGRVAAFRAVPDTHVSLSQLHLEMIAGSDPPAGAVPLVFIREARHV